MAYESRTNFDKEQTSIVSYQRRDTYFGAIVQTTSSVVKDLQQLQTDLHRQHQHDKEALIDLNQRFHILVERIQVLQTDNLRYLTAIAEVRQRFSGVNTIDIQSVENYSSLKTNFSTISNAKIDSEWDFELYQLQIAIYHKLIEIEQQSKDNRVLLLEDELKQSASMLITLRSSYAEVQREIHHLHRESEDLLQQYLALTDNWCSMRKQQQKWYLNIETLKGYIGFYKNLRSHSTRQYDYSSNQSSDTTQYWTFELDKVVKKIRLDFEAFYAEIYHQMTSYYETKTEELEINIKESINYQQNEMEQFIVVREKLQIDYEKIQQSYSYEKEILFKLESTYSKLEAEFKSIQLQQEEQLAIQSNDSQNIQESIVAMAYDVEEIRRNKSSLEVEIIIYRQLLECCGIEIPTVIPHRPPKIESGARGKISIRKNRKGAIGIKECAANGSYISLMNHSSNKNIDISRWVITRHFTSTQKLRYTIPDRVQLEAGNELRIYAKLNGGSGMTTTGSTTYQVLVNNNVNSWNEGDSAETYLFNHHGDEEATYSQSVAF